MRFTFHEFVALASNLNPRDAISSKTIKREKCVTPLVTEMIYEGELVLLKGRPGAGYVRVSTEHQKVDGFSIEEQIHRITHYFIERRQPFSIYSDASLSGFYPPQNQRLIERMIEKHARRYERNFRTLFLSGQGTRKYSDTERAGLERHLHEALANIRKSGSVVTTQEGEITLERRGRVKYRPAFTLLLEDLHKCEVVAVSDLSRLYRNEAIVAELCDRLEGCETRIVGLIEALDYLNTGEEDDSASMQRWFFGRMAEKQLNTMTVNLMRGTLQMLEQGKPHAKLPYFLTRDANGYAVYKPGAREALLRMIDLLMTPKETGQRRSQIEVSIQMQREFPTLKLGHKDEWGRRHVFEFLTNRALIGKHVHFGLEFDINTRIVDDETFERIQAVLDDNRRLTAPHLAARKRTQLRNESGVLEEKCYLATGLLRCICGGRLFHHAFGPNNRFQGYMCAKQTESKIKAQVLGEERIRHTRLYVPNVDDFLRDFIRSYREYFAGMVRDEEKLAVLRAEVAEANERLIEAKVALQRITDTQSAKLKKEAKEEGFDGADAEQYVSLHLRRDTKQERQSVETSQTHRDECEEELRSHLAQVEAETLNAKLDLWDELPTREQNAILLTIFRQWDVRGEDPHCVIVPIYRTGKELPPIPLKTSVQKAKVTGRENYSRRLPTIQEYIDIVFASRLEQNAA